MALTIEDGSLVAGANSYATVAECRAYAALRGLTLPVADGEVEILLIKAADYLESFEGRYKGSRVNATQALAWPREYVIIYGSDDFPVDEIPEQLKNAQCQLAFDAIANDLQATGTGREVVKEKVDVIEVEYAPGGGHVVQAVFAKAMAFLQPLFNSGFAVKSVRV